MFADQLVVRDIVVKGADEVVAIEPGAFDFVVPVIAEGFGEAHDVHPVARPVFSEMGRGEKAIDEAFISSGGGVAHEQIDFERGGREAGEHDAEAADERAAVGGGGGLQAGFVQGGDEKTIDGMGDAGHIGRGRGMCGLEGPVLFAETFVEPGRGFGLRCGLRAGGPGGSELNPFHDGRDFRVREFAAGGHFQTFVTDGPGEQAEFRIAGNQGRAAVATFQ